MTDACYMRVTDLIELLVTYADEAVEHHKASTQQLLPQLALTESQKRTAELIAETALYTAVYSASTLIREITQSIERTQDTTPDEDRPSQNVVLSLGRDMVAILTPTLNESRIRLDKLKG